MDNWAVLALVGVGVVVGVAIAMFVRRPQGLAQYVVTQPPSPQQITNEESWDMWEDEQGHIHTVIHRKVNR